MKLFIINHIRRVSKYFALCMALALTLQCEEKFELSLPLAVNSNELELTATGGKTQIMVYSTGDWNAVFDKTCNWAAIDKLKGTGNSTVLFSYSENLGVTRSVTLRLSTADKTQDVFIIQAGLTPSLKFGATKTEIAKTSLPVLLPLLTNLKYNLDDIEVTISYDDEASEQWISESVLTAQGLEFTAKENNSGAERQARVTLKLVDGLDREYTTYVDVVQQAAASFITTSKDKTEVPKMATKETVLLETNIANSFAFMTTEVIYANGSGWISNVLLQSNALTFDIAGNETGSPPSATIRLRLTDASGATLVDVNYPVLQSEISSKILPFPEIRAKISGESGEYKFTSDFDAIEGFIVSDAGNPNMETNPQTVYNNYDFTENSKTAYIEALDGAYGFRIKTITADENTLARYSRVIISLSGLTLEKESNPERYTLRGFASSNIISSTKGAAADLPVKEKKISQLTDADVYTFVKLTGTEVACPLGTWVNVNGGYVIKSAWQTEGITNGAYVDAVPTAIHDNAGGVANVLVNLLAPWCRSAINDGAGSISGIITHSKLVRYGAGDGFIGKYFVRPVTDADIALGTTPLGTTIAEWNWVGASGECSAASAPSATSVAAKIGSGTMTFTNTVTASIGANYLCVPANLGKTVTNNGAAFSRSWWNVTENRGEGFIFKVSTSGKSGGKLAINWSQCGGSGSATTYHVPALWQVEYSTDGTNYTVAPNSEYTVRPLPAWATNNMFPCPGYQTHCCFLPDELLNKSDVYIKLVAKSNKCGANSVNGGEEGTITATTNNGAVAVRFSSISVKYLPN